MSFNSWLQNLRSGLAPGRGPPHHGRRGSLRAATHRPNLEILDDRCLPAFIAPVDYAVGPYADDVEAGDFNGDAVLDLAAANWYGATVNPAAHVRCTVGFGRAWTSTKPVAPVK